MENKTYIATIIYTIEEITKFFIFDVIKKREIYYDYPKVLLTSGQKIAENLVKLSSAWKNNAMPQGTNINKITIIDKQLLVQEIKNESMLFYLSTMTCSDFISYMRQLLTENSQ